MLTRRDFLQVAAAAAVITGPSDLARAAAGQKISQGNLLDFEPLGQVTLLNFTDIHAQLVPLYFREPSMNIGIGQVHGLPPHLTGKEFLSHFGLKAGTPEAYALTSEGFSELAKQYGRIGGLAHMATLIKAIRAERGDKVLLIDNGDTWQGSYTALATRGEDMVDAMNALGVDAMTAHWEFTYGAERVQELVEKLRFPFLCGNVIDTEWEEKVFESTAFFERGGVRIAVIGQAFPYTPVANPRWMFPQWSFGIREETVQENVDAARAAGADLVVLASHDGFDVDRKLASRVTGIDVVLTGHTHDAIPAVVKVKDTLLVASGSHGKFLTRLDLQVENKKIKDFRFRLIPVFSDAIRPDPDIAKVVAGIRAPHETELQRVLGKTESLLYRRGNFNGTFDDLICQAIIEERDVQIALSPGFRWGASLPPGADITVDDVFSQTALTYPAVYRNQMSGKFLYEIMEDVADNIFNPDPYYQQGGDMVRVGGMAYAIDVAKPMGQRISDMTLTATGEKIDPAKTYTVGGWASVNENTEGPAIYDLVSSYIQRKKTVQVQGNHNIKISGI